MGGVVAAVVATGLILAGPACATSPPYQEMAKRLVGADQGVFARAEDGTVLAEVEADRPVPCQVDGDTAGTTPLEIDLRPRTLRVLAPPETRNG